ncbi:MAG: FG-GAP-like repeat-containing protein, partial [Rhodothermales bacterium]|nr:FG-GAP-like repeat-containing protein [Rhodothermales bacterium]
MPDRALLLAALLIALALPACGGSDAPLEPDSEEYREAVSAFYAGLAGIEAGSDVFSEEKMLRVTELAPREPAAWANLGVLAMRRNNIEEADARLARARELAPGHGDILVLSGLLESLRGDFEAAIAYLRRAIEVEPENVRAKYALAELLERQGGEGSEAEVQQLLQAMLETRPENLAILLELARMAARTGDADALRSVVDRLGARAPAWPEEVRDQFETVQAAVEEGATAQAATQIAFLRNVLLRVPQFRQDLAAVQTPADQVGELIQRFLFLPSPQPAPAAADDSLGFIVEPLPAEDGAWAMGRIVTVAEEGPPVVLLANATTVQLVGGPALPYPGDQATAPGLANVEELDYDYDFQMDLAFAGPAGLRLYRNEGDFQFTEVTASLGLPASVTQAAYTSVWAIDLDSEGDLDLVLGTPAGPPRVLRNQGDGTFEPIDRFGDAGRLVDLGWADLDGDGDPDAALLTDDGTVRVYVNERAGAFRPAAPAAQTGVGALAVADVNADATVDLVLFRDDGAVVRLSGTPDGNAWDQQELARWDGLRDAPARLFVQDLDNNGALDLLASTDAAARVWLGTADGFIPPRDAPIDVPVYAVVDLTGEGRLDLLAIGGDGRPQRLVSVGTKAYNWYRLRVQA